MARTACEWIGDVDAGGSSWGGWHCVGTWSAALHLACLIESDPLEPEVKDLAEALAEDRPTPATYARRVHAWVQRHVPFVREKPEVFQSPGAMLRSGRGGDCDCHVRLVAALLGAVGIASRVVFFGYADGAEHVALQARLGPAAVWCETTIKARFGEHPYAARERLNASGEGSSGFLNR